MSAEGGFEEPRQQQRLRGGIRDCGITHLKLPLCRSAFSTRAPRMAVLEKAVEKIKIA